MPELDKRDIYVGTRLGGKFYPFAPEREPVLLDEVVRSLAATCRWRGHTLGVLSVAEHSVMVARQVAPEHRLYALLHDAGEAYLCDMPAPLKHFSFFRVPDGRGGVEEIPFSVVEEGILQAVLRSVGLPGGPMPREVFDADLRVRLFEHEQLVVPECSTGFTPMSAVDAEASWWFFYEQWVVAAPRAMKVGVN